MAYISQVTLPNGSVYDLKDKNTPNMIDFTNAEIDQITGLDDADAEEYSNNIAQDVIENYIGTELCGVNQSVEDAINGLNSSIGVINGKIGNVILPTTAQTITGAIAEHEEDISTINGNLTDISNQIIVKRKTVTGTTSNYGTINLGLQNTNYEVVMVKSSLSSHRVYVAAVGLGYYGVVVSDAAAWSPVTNTNVTLTVHYRPIAEHEEDISTINGNLSPTSISRPTVYQNRVSILAGGYIKVGRIVVVDIQVTAALSSYSGGTIFTGFPASLGTNSISAYVLDGSSQIPMGAHCTSSGNMTITSPSGITMTDKDIYIAGVYIAN